MFAFLGSIGPAEMAVLLGLGVLLFGRKLPDIGRSLGKTIVEFKKGFNGLEDEISTSGSAAKPAIGSGPAAAAGDAVVAGVQRRRRDEPAAENLTLDPREGSG